MHSFYLEYLLIILLIVIIIYIINLLSKKTRINKIKSYITNKLENNYSTYKNSNNDKIKAQNNFIDKIVLGGKFKENNEQKKFSRGEIDDNQNNFFDFYDKINFSSGNNIDPVDRINEDRINNNEFNGQIISEVYDKLVNNYNVAEKPILDIEKDLVKKPAGNEDYYSNYHWRYVEDSVNNGGKFYDNVEGNDNYFDSKKAVD